MFVKFIRTVLLVCLVLLFYALHGCATPATTIRTVEYINTPTYCNVPMPEQPVLEEGLNKIVTNFARVLVYKDELEVALHCCRGDAICPTNK